MPLVLVVAVLVVSCGKKEDVRVDAPLPRAGLTARVECTDDSAPGSAGARCAERRGGRISETGTSEQSFEPGLQRRHRGFEVGFVDRIHCRRLHRHRRAMRHPIRRRARPPSADRGRGSSTLFKRIGTLVWMIFIVNFAIELTLAPRKLIYLRKN